LVGNGARPDDPRPHPRPAAGKPIVADPGLAEKPRRLGGHLLRPKSAGGTRVELGPDSASGTFEVLFRLYGPEKPLFDKTWKLPDIEKIAAP
jgi:hypothetical protein